MKYYRVVAYEFEEIEFVKVTARYGFKPNGHREHLTANHWFPTKAAALAQAISMTEDAVRITRRSLDRAEDRLGRLKALEASGKAVE